jgi:hypothetical protein
LDGALLSDQKIRQSGAEAFLPTLLAGSKPSSNIKCTVWFEHFLDTNVSEKKTLEHKQAFLPKSRG